MNNISLSPRNFCVAGVAAMTLYAVHQHLISRDPQASLVDNAYRGVAANAASCATTAALSAFPSKNHCVIVGIPMALGFLLFGGNAFRDLADKATCFVIAGGLAALVNSYFGKSSVTEKKLVIRPLAENGTKIFDLVNENESAYMPRIGDRPSRIGHNASVDGLRYFVDYFNVCWKNIDDTKENSSDGKSRTKESPKEEAHRKLAEWVGSILTKMFEEKLGTEKEVLEGLLAMNEKVLDRNTLTIFSTAKYQMTSGESDLKEYAETQKEPQLNEQLEKRLMRAMEVNLAT